PRMELIELPHLSVGAPAEITAACISQVEMRDLVEAARRVKAGSQLVGERLVVDEAVCLGRHDGALVQVHGIDRAPLETGDLSADESYTIIEVLRTIRRPGTKLSRVSAERSSMRGVRVGALGLAKCSAAQCGIELIFSLLHQKERQECGCRVPFFHFV